MSEQVQTVRIRLDDGRAVAVPRATPAEAWAAAVDDGMRAVHSARLAAASRVTT